MSAIEKANELQQQAIAIVLAERPQIDQHPAHIGPGKRLKRSAVVPKRPPRSQSQKQGNHSQITGHIRLKMSNMGHPPFVGRIILR
jgi:hypothetical protein